MASMRAAKPLFTLLLVHTELSYCSHCTAYLAPESPSYCIVFICITRIVLIMIQYGLSRKDVHCLVERRARLRIGIKYYREVESVAYF